MALKPVVSDIKEVPEALRDQYKKDESSGGFVLDVEGVVPKEKLEEVNRKLSEFRDNNVRLLKERDEITQKFAGVDPDEYKKLKSTPAVTLEKPKEKEKGQERPEVDVIKLRDEIAKDIETRFSSKFGTLEQQLKNKEAEIAQLKIDEQLMKLSVEKGFIDPEDVLFRAKQIFRYQDGKVRAIDNSGAVVYSKKDVTKEIDFEEFLGDLVTSKPHLVKPSAGTGAGGGKKSELKPGVREISTTDPRELGKNLKDIASGKVIVSTNSF